MYVTDYIPDFLDNTLDLHLNEGVLLTNSSYSNGCNAGYTAIAETVDQQIHENPTLCHIFSAGNSNGNDCDYGAGNQWGNITGGHKQGKNVIATANIFSDGSLVNSSSRGPAHDGRIKPDISANGQDQISTDPDNTYSPFGGTSGAAPCVMGTMAQLYHAYSDLNGGDIPESALIKATILNTANDLGNEGPDFRFGWGHLNAYRAVKLLEDERYFDGMIDQGEFPQHLISIPEGTKQVRFMLYWMDEEGTQMASPALVNDLNLTILDPQFNSLLPWVLDPTPNPTNLNLPAGNGIDNLNNVEQVLINNPEGGDYFVFINGLTIPNGAIKYYVLYEVIGEDDITVTYPNGGEGLVPGEMERIHWDALGDDGEFEIEFSEDGGNTWNPLATVAGSERWHNWQVPDTQTGQVQVRVSRDGITDSSDANLSIGRVPTNLQISQACPEFVRLSWNAIDNATGYEVYQLGEKYMEIVGSTTELFFDFTITSPVEENWFSVRAIGENDFAGRRAIAVGHNSGLLACVLDLDVANNSLISPSAGALLSCDNFDQDVIIEIQNNGLTDVESLDLFYQVNNDPPIMETYNIPITPAQSITYTFNTPLSCLLYTSPSPRDRTRSRMPSSA